MSWRLLYDVDQPQSVGIRQVLIDAGIRCDCGFVAWMKMATMP
ncbi:MAG: hypothetical protein ACOY32_01555 [Thermodesulfobacteriota bacterium]